MERRKILLGSGAALATVLAGCSSDETGDDSGSNDDDSDESLTDDGDDGSDDTDDSEDIPGVDEGEMKVDSDKITVTDVHKDGDEIDVVATTTTTDPDVLAAELESLGDDLSHVIKDPNKFKAEINSVTWVLEQDGAKVMSFYVDVQWAIEYMNGEMGKDAFMDKVLATTDETK